MEIVWSAAADRDLAQIYSYYEPRSYRGARSVLREIFKAVDALSDLPLMGAVADLELEQEYRAFVVGNYKIFYRIEEGHLFIVRLWDTRQDPARFFIPID